MLNIWENDGERRGKFAYLRETWGTCLQKWGSVMHSRIQGEQLGRRGTPDASPAFSILDPHMTVSTHTAQEPTDLYLQPDLAGAE